ncbi:MAG: hypothetical protein ACYCTL_13010 [Acidimicrobiales bacterium]
MAPVGAVFVVAVAVAACGGSTSSTPASARHATATAGSTSATGSGEPAAFHGTSGTVASVSGDTLEVQNPSIGQVTVTMSATTAMTQTIAATSSSLVIGECVAATGTKSASGVVDATSVTLSQPGPGGCARGAFGAVGLVGPAQQLGTPVAESGSPPVDSTRHGQLVGPESSSARRTSASRQAR